MNYVNKGILNWKYKGETALRLSGLPYSIIRATGLVSAPVVSDSTDVFSTPRRLQVGETSRTCICMYTCVYLLYVFADRLLRATP